MKLIAVHTIHGRKVLRAPDPKNVKDRGRSTTMSARPGEEFDTVEFGMSDAEAQEMVARGAARRKMREVTEADEVKPAAAAGAGVGAGASAT